MRRSASSSAGAKRVAATLSPCAFRRPAIVSGGSGLNFPLRGQRALGRREGRVDPETSNLSNQVRCSRCRRAPRDDADYVAWEALDDGTVCPGCLTMLEEGARSASE